MTQSRTDHGNVMDVMIDYKPSNSRPVSGFFWCQSPISDTLKQ